jgi:hypothetical protein
MSLQTVNPYSAANKRKMAVASRSGTPIALGGRDVPRGQFGFNRSGAARMSSEPLVAANGEFNANNKREVMQAIQTLHSLFNTGAVEARYGYEDAKANVEARAAHQQRLVEAWNDRSGQSWQALGEVIGDEIWQTLGREGFARKTMLLKPLGKGETGRLRVRRKDVVSFFVTANPNVVASQVRQFYCYPPEFYLLANIVIEDKEIEQASGDLLDDKYQDGLEQILVREDNVWLTLARNAAPTSNDLFFFNTFTPTVFSEMRTQVARWGIPVTTAIIAFDLWNDIIADTEFSSWFDPVSKHEIVLEGSLGSLLGVQLVTDAFRHETLKVLDAGEVFFLGAPQTLGGITQRKELMTQSIDKYNQGRPERGWFLEQIEGMAIVNDRALTRGQRI